MGLKRAEVLRSKLQQRQGAWVGGDMSSKRAKEVGKKLEGGKNDL